MPPQSNHSYAKKIALPPGSLVHVGRKTLAKAELSLISYNADQHESRAVADLAEAQACISDDRVSWLNITGLHDTVLLEAVGEAYAIHPLTLEDILNTNQRPKAESFDGYLYFVLRMIRYDAEEKRLDTEQVSLVLLPNLVITFQERPGDVLDPLRQRIQQAKGRVRQHGADYLFYSIMDIIIDNYFLCLEDMGDDIEDLETQALEAPTPTLTTRLQRLKRELLFLRKAVWPLREQIAVLLREEHSMIQASTNIYLRDLYDHTIQIMDTIETFRDMTSGLLDVYLSSLSNRMNEVMKVLTIIATIFIPLTFVAGVYGMNFEFMPELHFQWAYPAVLLLCVAIAGTMIIYFRRKGWL